MTEISIEQCLGDLFNNMFIISFPECSERSLQGFTCKEDESVAYAINRQLAPNELCCYRSDGYSQESWEADKVKWLQEYNKQNLIAEVVIK